MGITQAQAKTTSTNTNQTTAPANSANRYTGNRYTGNRYTGNFNPAHHSIALIILIFLILHDVVYLLQHPCLCTTHSKAATRNTADLKTVKLL
jgi:hypothetical protein